MNLGKPVNIPKLNESAAIELGAELVGESVIFSIATGILIYEFVRQSRKEAVKETERAAQMEQITNDLKTLYIQKAQQESQVRELIRILEEKIPDSNFNPRPYNQFDLPEHHRDTEPEQVSGAFDTVKGWVFNAIDFVLPPVSNNPPENQTTIVVIQQKTDSSDCKCEDGSTTKTTAPSSSTSEKLVAPEGKSAS